MCFCEWQQINESPSVCLNTDNQLRGTLDADAQPPVCISTLFVFTHVCSEKHKLSGLFVLHTRYAQTHTLKETEVGSRNCVKSP